ncbi:MAG TPA: hypothetical protein VJP83_03420, partial [Terriglobales bacterium]|nr:hypothetical protein [Terriglobales bacterium]
INQSGSRCSAKCHNFKAKETGGRKVTERAAGVFGSELADFVGCSAKICHEDDEQAARMPGTQGRVFAHQR